MQIVIEKNSKGTLKLSAVVISKLIFMLLKSDNYKIELADINVKVEENNGIIAEIKLPVEPKSDLIDLKNKINKMILKRVDSVLNAVLVNTHLIFVNKEKEELVK